MLRMRRIGAHEGGGAGPSKAAKSTGAAKIGGEGGSGIINIHSQPEQAKLLKIVVNERKPAHGLFGAAGIGHPNQYPGLY